MHRLTPKQREVLALVADSRTSKEIASLLGISESAVNQRIEMVRSRMGGLPRSELARLYRHTVALNPQENAENSGTWQKIQVSDSLTVSQGSVAESLSPSGTDGSHRRSVRDGDGSQLAASLFQADNPWLWRRKGATAFGRLAFAAAIVVTALFFASDTSPSLHSFGF